MPLLFMVTFILQSQDNGYILHTHIHTYTHKTLSYDGENHPLWQKNSSIQNLKKVEIQNICFSGINKNPHYLILFKSWWETFVLRQGLIAQ